MKRATTKSSKSAALTKRPSRKREEPFTIAHVWDRLTREQRETVTGLAASMVASSGVQRAPKKRVSKEDLCSSLVEIGAECQALKQIIAESIHGQLSPDTLATAGERLCDAALIHVDDCLEIIGESTSGGFSDGLRPAAGEGGAA